MISNVSGNGFVALPKASFLQKTAVTSPNVKASNDTFVSFCGTKSPNSIATRVALVKNEMKKENLDALIVASTDDYLTEYIEPSQSQRQFVSGFSGSEGDAIITPGKSRLIVDSRYFIQADNQVDSTVFKVEKKGLNDAGELIAEGESERKLKIFKDLTKDNPGKTFRVGYDSYKTSLEDVRALQQKIAEAALKIELVPTKGNLVDRVWAGKQKPTVAPVRVVPSMHTGETSASKLARLRANLHENKLAMFVVTDLGDIAYLSNSRGADIVDNATFRSKLVVTEKKAVLFCNPNKINLGVKRALQGDFEIKPEEEFLGAVRDLTKGKKAQKIAISSDTVTKGVFDDIKAAIPSASEIVELDASPVAKMRAVKNPQEISAYKEAIKRTDIAVTQVMNWLNDGINNGDAITEKHLEDKMRDAHFANGANALSFAIIPAAGANSAIVHYENGDPNVLIRKNDLVLVDTGAYYESGLATDLTRTWIAGGEKAIPSAKQKEVYTNVVRGALRGLFADLPPNASGFDLDAIVRDPIKAHNKDYNYGHSTGHGVGVMVHDSGPYISPNARAKNHILKPGMVFSIEPGTYLKDWGGVRFENLVTVVSHPNPKKASQGWHKVKCLSFAPIDHNLIDTSLLNEKEQKLLSAFDRRAKAVVRAAKKSIK